MGLTRRSFLTGPATATLPGWVAKTILALSAVSGLAVSAGEEVHQESRPSNAAKKLDFGVAPNPFFVPEGGGSNDTFPIHRNGVWHLFHMRVPVIAHYTSRDLISWEERPIVVAPGKPGEPDHGGALCTGCVIEHDGTFYCFYTANQTICLATSKDFDYWAKFARNPVLRGDDKQYERANFRDPFVLFNRHEGLWWMLFGTRLMRQPGQRAGCVGLAKSKDLYHWELAKPLWAPSIGPHADCPQLFRQGERWYLTYLQRHARYRVADSLSGPWRRAPVRDLGTMNPLAGSRPATDGRRWISFPFIGIPDGTPKEKELGIGNYKGGPLAVPRQWEFHADGSITLRPADEVIQAMHAAPGGDREPLDGARSRVGRWELPEERTARSLDPLGGTLVLPDPPLDFYFEADVSFASEETDVHLLMNSDPGLTRGYQLSLHPDRDLATLRPLSYWDGVSTRVLETQSVKLVPNRPVKLRVFRSGPILECFIDDRATLTHLLYRHNGGNLALEFRDGCGTFSDVFIRRLETR